MDSARLEKIQMIIELARGMVSQRRERFLDAACGGDAELRATVETRLNDECHRNSEVVDSEGDATEKSMSKEHESIDSIVLDAISSGEESCASMHDANQTATSVGLPIDAYCDERRLNVVTRLQLFQEVCRHVDQFHRHGVLHGGLSPTQILVSEGDPLRVIVQEPLNQPAASTSGRLYTSPEQVLGEPITVATDVYSLGVVLYQLLTGRYPYHLSSTDTGDVSNAVCVQVPERPSLAVERQDEPERSPGAVADARNTSPASLKRLLASDLDLIVLRALHKEPDSRYPSADRFASDIDLFLHGYPVQAHPTSRVYQIGRFIKRHKLAVALGVIATVLVIIGGLATTTMMLRARRHLSRTMSLYQSSEAAIDDLFERIDGEHMFDQPGMAASRASLLEALLPYYERMRDQAGRDLESLTNAAKAQERVARINRLIGPLDVSVWQYEQALTRYEDLMARTPGSALHEDELIHVLVELGETKLAIGDQQTEARSYLERAVRSLESKLGSPSKPGKNRRELARALQNLAELERAQGHLEQARAAGARVIQITADLVAENPRSLRDMIMLANARSSLGRTLIADPSTIAGGISSFRLSIDLRDTVIREFPQRTDQVYRLALDLGELALLFQVSGQVDRAIEMERRSQTLLEQLDRRFPETADFPISLYLAYDLMSRLYNSQGETKLALERSEQAKSVLERLIAQHPRDSSFQIDLSRCYSFLGRLHQHDGALDKALTSFQRSVDLLESCQQLNAEDRYQLAVNLARCIVLIGGGSQVGSSEGESGLGAADSVRRQVYGKRAVAALDQAFNSGLTKLEIYETDPELNPLRNRPDFQKLLENIAKKEKEKQ